VNLPCYVRYKDSEVNKGKKQKIERGGIKIKVHSRKKENNNNIHS